MAIKTYVATACALAAISIPAAARSQSTTSAPLAPTMSAPAPAEAGAQLEQWTAELKQIESKLDVLERQALADPKIQEQQDELGGVILATMIRIDPSVEARLTRLKDILTEAQAPGVDEARLEVLATEVEQIHPQVARAQAQAVEDPAVSQRMAAYKDALDKHMTAIDPGTTQLIARRAELQKMITRAGE